MKADDNPNRPATIRELNEDVIFLIELMVDLDKFQLAETKALLSRLGVLAALVGKACGGLPPGFSGEASGQNLERLLAQHESLHERLEHRLARLRGTGGDHGEMPCGG